MSELRKVLVNFFPKIYESCFVDRLVPPFPWDGGIRRSIYISFTRSYTLRTYATRPKCLTCSKQQFPKMGVSIELSISQLRLLTFFFSPSFFSFFFPCFSLCNFLSQKCSVHTGSGRDGCEMQELYVWVCRYGLVASKTGRVGL